MTLLGRRAFLAGVGSCAIVLSAPAAIAARRTPRPKTLSLYNLQTGERLREVFWADGNYLSETLARFNWLLRDYRSNETRSIDPALLELLHTVTHTLEYRSHVEVISGYRSPETNGKLAKTDRKVARNSLHTQGMAVDVRMPGRRLYQVRDAARQLRRGGVGYYPRGKFVHLDTGNVRYW